jgi:hypothetical protein
MPDRTTIVLPPRLKQLATARARERKISFSEFVRRAVEDAVRQPRAGGQLDKDPFWSDVAVYDGPVPADLSENHDKYLYDDIDP